METQSRHHRLSPAPRHPHLVTCTSSPAPRHLHLVTRTSSLFSPQMKPEILLVARIYPPTLAALEREYTVHDLCAAGEPEAFMKEVSGGVRAAVTTGLVGFDRARMEALPKLEIIASFGTPNGTVDLAAAQERGVVVANTPDSIQELVA